MAKSKRRKPTKKKITLFSAAIIIAISAILSLLFPNVFNVKNTAIEASQGASTKVHFIDIGQGDSVLLQSGGSFALIDAGDIKSKQRLIAYLTAANVKALDYLIITHGHADHIGAVDEVIKNFDVKQILLPQFEKAPMPTTAVFENMLSLIEQNNISAEIMTAGSSFGLGTGTIEILSDGIESDNQNNISPFVKFTSEKLVYLSAGDAEKASEKEILNNTINLNANVFKASHHGSSTSNTKQLLAAVTPKVAVISCGLENDFGHPHKEVLNAFKAVNASVYRTDKSGAVIAYIDESGELAVATEKGE